MRSVQLVDDKIDVLRVWAAGVEVDVDDLIDPHPLLAAACIGALDVDAQVSAGRGWAQRAGHTAAAFAWSDVCAVAGSDAAQVVPADVRAAVIAAASAASWARQVAAGECFDAAPVTVRAAAGVAAGRSQRLRDAVVAAGAPQVVADTFSAAASKIGDPARIVTLEDLADALHRRIVFEAGALPQHRRWWSPVSCRHVATILVEMEAAAVRDHLVVCEPAANRARDVFAGFPGPVVLAPVSTVTMIGAADTGDVQRWMVRRSRRAVRPARPTRSVMTVVAAHLEVGCEPDVAMLGELAQVWASLPDNELRLDAAWTITS